MANERVANAAQNTVSSGLNNTTQPVTFTMTGVTNFPTVPNFRIIVDSEILLVTAVAGSNFTCQRAQEGTTNASHANGATVTQVLTALGTEQMMIDRLPGELCEGRLTLTSGTAITTADVTAATNVLFTPYRGNKVAVYTGTKWIVDVLTEQTVAVPATTSTPFDVFAFDNGDAINIETLNWTNGTTRATALVTQDGVLVKSGALTRRYLGTCQTTAVSGQTEDSALNRLVWNYYNRVRKPLRVWEQSGVASWAYATAAWRSANGSALNRTTLVQGVAEVPLYLTVNGLTSTTTTGGCDVGIGENSTTVLSGNIVGGHMAPTTVSLSTTTAILNVVPAIGSNFYQWIEFGNTGVTFFGATQINKGMGLAGFWEC